MIQAFTNPKYHEINYTSRHSFMTQHHIANTARDTPPDAIYPQTPPNAGSVQPPAGAAMQEYPPTYERWTTISNPAPANTAALLTKGPRPRALLTAWPLPLAPVYPTNNIADGGVYVTLTFSRTKYRHSHTSHLNLTSPSILLHP